MARLVKTAVLLICAALLFVAATKLGAVTRSIYNRVVSEDERYYLPAAGWLRVFAAGYNELVADLVWVKTVVYFGGTFLSKGSDSKDNNNNRDSFTVNYLTTAVKLDPKFRRLYTNGSGLTLFQRDGVITEESVNAAIELLELGRREFPDDGEIAFHLGFLHYFEMEPFLPDDEDDPAWRFHKTLGADLIRRAALMDGAPSYAADLSATLMKKEDLDDLVIEHLKKLLVKETNEKIRATLFQQLKKEMGEAAEREIKLSEELVAKWRSQMPFIPFDLYLLIHRDYPLEELVDPLWWSDRYLGLVDEDVDLEPVDGVPITERDDR